VSLPLTLACTFLFSALAVPAVDQVDASGTEVHNVHVTRGRMAIENNVAVTRIRFFQHDLEAAIASFHHLDSLTIEHTARSDSLFLSYFNDRFSLETDDRRIPPQILSSGENKDIWWYELEFRHDQPIDDLTIQNEMLFDLFPDQKHFLKLTFFPSSETRTLYFVNGAARYSVWRDEE
jgi:hypothetical protein